MARAAVKAAPGRYTAVAVVLHWLMAIAIIGMLALGFYMNSDLVPDKSTKMQLFQLHKSVGIVLLWLIAVRILWRETHRLPKWPDMRPWEKMVAAYTHLGLYLLMIAMPLTGWLIVSSSAFGFPTMLFGTGLEWPHFPGVSGNEPVHNAAETAHGWLAWVFIVMIAGHALAVVKHWVFDRENILVRMWFPMKRHTEKLLLIGALVLASSAAVQARPYAVDYTGSKLGFSGIYADKPFTGDFRKWTASIDFDAKNVATTKIEATIDTASAVTGTATNDATLPSADWFDVAHYPQATFKADSVEDKGAGNYLAHGTLTLKGKTLKQDLAFTLTPADGAGPTMVAGTASLNRLDYGIGAKSDASGEWVGKEIKLTLTLKATPQ